LTFEEDIPSHILQHASVVLNEDIGINECFVELSLHESCDLFDGVRKFRFFSILSHFRFQFSLRKRFAKVEPVFFVEPETPDSSSNVFATY
jgi:hypothetical protein